MTKTALFLVLLIGFGTLPSWAQQVTGNLHGRALTTDGEPVAGVLVIVRGPNLPGERVTTTGSHGEFRALALPPGLYTVRFTRIGYRQIVIEDVPVRLGKTSALGEIRLEWQPMQLAPLVVTVSRPTVDPTTTTVGMNLESRTFEELPTGRDYRSLITLIPQVNESFFGDGVTIAGATGTENAYYIDGMNVTDPRRADGGIDLPYNFIDQIELKTGGYEAEYGRALGGIVNVVTHSGGNELRASAFGFFTGSALASSPERGIVDLGTGGFTSYDVGASVGGPVIRDRLWYFLAYDAKVEKEDLPLPGLGVQTDQTITHHFAGKLSWRATPNTDLVLTVIGDPSTRDLIGNRFWAQIVPPATLANPDPFLADFNDGGITLSLSGKHFLGQHLLFEGMLGRASIWERGEPMTARGRTEPLFLDQTQTTGVWSGGYGQAFDRANTRTSASLAGTYFFGDNSVKAGVQYEDNRLHEQWRWQADGPDGAGAIWRADQSLYITLPLDFDVTVHNRIASLFAQTSYLVHPWLRLNAGLRWDGQYFSGEESGLTGSITDQFQPRLGIILSPGRPGSQKVTVSYGRLYEQVPTLAVAFWWGPLLQDLFVYDHDPREDPTGGFLVAFKGTAEENIEGQHLDQFTVGYERRVGGVGKIGIRGIYRDLRQIIVDAPIEGDVSVAGNPGRGRLDFLPQPEANYLALELTASKLDGSALNFAVSYVLSRKYGNYVGLSDLDVGGEIPPHSGSNFNNPAELENAKGLLPNDRTHVFKAFGSYRSHFGLTVGTFFTLQSGTPLSELGGNPTNPFDFVFLQPRGTAGRTPWLWDLDLRFSYHLAGLGLRRGSRLILDGFHLFSPNKAVLIDQHRFLAADPVTGEQTSPNPNFGKPLLHQPPMTLRLGVEVVF